jgi:DNA-binding IclR family transcriptional regulator
VNHKLSVVETLVLECVRQHPEGCGADAIVEATGRQHSSVGRCLQMLTRLGLLRATGTTLRCYQAWSDGWPDEKLARATLKQMKDRLNEKREQSFVDRVLRKRQKAKAG